MPASFQGSHANCRDAAGLLNLESTYYMSPDPGAGFSWVSLCLCHCCRMLVVKQLLSLLRPDLEATLKPDCVGSMACLDCPCHSVPLQKDCGQAAGSSAAARPGGGCQAQ